MKTAIAAAGLLIPASAGLLLSGVPTVLCPLPATTVFPAFFLSQWHLSKSAIIVPTLLFFAWCPPFFTGDASIPKRSRLLFWTIVALNIAYFALNWKAGVHYQGARYVTVITLMNLGWAGFLSLGLVKQGGSTIGRSYSSLVWHWTLFAWLAWYAFPYMGELP
jgi:hypothetical protein